MTDQSPDREYAREVMNKLHRAMEEPEYGSVKENRIDTRPRIERLVEKYTADETEKQKPENKSAANSFRPWNYEDFLSHLHTFQKPYNWFAKHDNISAMRCAQFGWTNSGMNQLTCSLCQTTCQHSHPTDNDPAFLSQSHSEACGWRSERCPEHFLLLPHYYQRPLLVQTLETRMASVNAFMKGRVMGVDLSLVLNSGDGLTRRMKNGIERYRRGEKGEEYLLPIGERDGEKKGEKEREGGLGLVESVAEALEGEEMGGIRGLFLLASMGWSLSPLSPSAPSLCCTLCGRSVPLSPFLDSKKEGEKEGEEEKRGVTGEGKGEGEEKGEKREEKGEETTIESGEKEEEKLVAREGEREGEEEAEGEGESLLEEELMRQVVAEILERAVSLPPSPASAPAPVPAPVPSPAPAPAPAPAPLSHHLQCFKVVREHRYFCPWSRPLPSSYSTPSLPSSSPASPSSVPLYPPQLFLDLIGERSRSRGGKRERVEGKAEGEAEERGTDVSPQQMFKKIRSLLAEATKNSAV